MSLDHRALLSGLLLTWVCSLAACSFSSHASCATSGDCAANQTCYRGFCLSKVTKSPTAPVAGRSSEPLMDAAMPVGPMTGMSTNPVATMPDAAVKDASVVPSMMMTTPAADAQVPPKVDSGMVMSPVCVLGETRACAAVAMSTTAAPGCTTGVQNCDRGLFGPCIPVITPSTELCNALDDDCDGRTDETTDVLCYPDGQAGCTLSGDKTISRCTGLCSPGKQVCVAGQLQACSGMTTPLDEVCTSGGTAADENCDGAIDEHCACTGTTPRTCYTGPEATVNVGTCKAGSQPCTNGELGACMGSVVPQAETCANENADDDCNGIRDDLVNRGTACSVATNQGLCRAGTLQCVPGNAQLTCVTVAPVAESCNQLDDDCDAKIDETIDLQTDAANCGSCGKACMLGESCCAGSCTNLAADNNNCGGCGVAHACAPGNTCCNSLCQNLLMDSTSCGACGRPCPMGQACCTGTCVDAKTDINNCGRCGEVCSGGSLPACCSGLCADLLTDKNCGTCGHECGSLNGAMCSCMTTTSGTMCVVPQVGACN